ncbi:hypothetical protein TNCV_1500061 [Trichonephila clavipes]|nr:hypothetical protein TNCV_1500061 [Trichonephila clavipes]
MSSVSSLPPTYLGARERSASLSQASNRVGLGSNPEKGMAVSSSGKEVKLSPVMDSRLELKIVHPFCLSVPVDLKNAKMSNLQELLDDDPTQQQLAKALNVSQETINRCLRAKGKINKLDYRIPPDLKERQMEKRKVT